MAIKIKSIEKTSGNYKSITFYMDCTKYVNELLGGLAKEAWVELIESNISAKDETAKAARHIAEQTIEDFKRHKSFSFDSAWLYITFKNGKQISIYNSEWGAMKPWEGDLK